MTEEQACQTPMSDHVAQFWNILETEKVRILIGMHQPDSFGGLGHWDSSSFPDDVAKALVAERDENKDDIRWAVNVLLEKIAAKFEANDTWDIWRSDAAAVVRSFKHGPAVTSHESHDD